MKYMVKESDPHIALHVAGLCRKFGELTAVDNLSFNISRNEIFGLLGPNGAGKTTTINMICGLLPRTSGTIEFPGYGAGDIKKIIGYCPQENIFYPKLTCMEQIMFTGRMYDLPSLVLRKRADKLLTMLGLGEKADVLASRLSGGMKRRLNICLALIHDPEILIMDEPEAGLDPQSRILVRDFIKGFSNEKTVILTTHNMDEADRMADRIAIMDYGRLLLLDTPRKLKKTIGEGDILEIRFHAPDTTALENFINKTGTPDVSISKNNETVFIRHHDAVSMLPAVKQKAEEEKLTISEIKMRENTLEDVFIKLTGRSLRQ